MENLMPFIGAIVYYYPGDGDPRPAIVTSVHYADCVNLVVFRDGTLDYGAGAAAEMRTSILRGEGSDQWGFPPLVVE